MRVDAKVQNLLLFHQQHCWMNLLFTKATEAFSTKQPGRELLRIASQEARSHCLQLLRAHEVAASLKFLWLHIHFAIFINGVKFRPLLLFSPFAGVSALLIKIATKTRSREPKNLFCGSKYSSKSSKRKEPTLQPRLTAKALGTNSMLPWWVCQQSSWSRPVVVQMLSKCNDTKLANFKWRHEGHFLPWP